VYRYQLEGLNSGWNYSADNILHFSKLPAGSYKLIWQASANEFIDTPATTTFSFTVRLPFWKTWWFVLLAMTTSIAVLYGFIRWRILQVKKYAQLEQEKIQARFDTLRNQINPHFLFNSFNALIGEIEDNPKAAVAYVQHLSLFFRNMVSYRDKEWITLQEELHILEHYKVLQQRRYGNALQFNIQINTTTAKQYLIAPLVLQMLAENAIKHNAVSTDTPLTVNITTTATHVIVANNINKRITPAEGTGIGLQNIQKRYLLLTGKKVTIKHTDQIFEVAIPLVTT
jgi:LytS/YehU family sensor histidine kinase